MSPIFLLPGELLYVIVEKLGLEDAFVLGMTCRYFRDIIRDNSICRLLVEKHASYSDESSGLRSSWEYGRALRVFAKRRLAIANLQPFTAAVVAEADMHIYCNETLVYVKDRVLYILPLRRDTTVHRETAVDVRMMLDQAVRQSGGTTRYAFRPLHYAAGIVSSVYAHHRLGPGWAGVQEHWLVLFNPDTGWTTSCRLPFPHHRLFVRNDKNYLIYGMFTGRRFAGPGEGGEGGGAHDETGQLGVPNDVGGEGFRRRWVLRRFDLLEQVWSAKLIYLDDVLGLADYGVSLCFEIIDGYFYAVANQQRFLDDQHRQRHIYSHDDDDFVMEDDDDNVDTGTGTGSDGFNKSGHGGYGVGDEEDESDDQSNSSEVDGEQDNGNNGHPRSRASIFSSASYYSCFRFPLSDPDRIEKPTLASRWRRRNDEGALDDRWTTLSIVKSATTGDIMVVESRKEWLRGRSSSRRTYYTQKLVWASEIRQRKRTRTETKARPRKDVAGSLDSRSSFKDGGRMRKEKRKLRLSDLQRTRRLADEVHPGDDAALVMPLTLGACAGRFYSTTAATFIDLLNQPSASEPMTQRLILRAGSRRPRFPRGSDAGSERQEAAQHSDKPCEKAQPCGSGCSSEPGSDLISDSDYNTKLYPMRDIENSFVVRDAAWPRQGNSCSGNGTQQDTDADEKLNRILNPPNHYGNVSASWDDRLLVYSTGVKLGSRRQNTRLGNGSSDDKDGSLNTTQAIVLVSFDPTLCLPGLPVWGQQEEQNNEGQKEEHRDQFPERTAAAWVSSIVPRYRSINTGYDFSHHINTGSK